MTAAKIQDQAITGAKIANGTITGAKIANGAITGANVNAATLGTVPNSATTNTVKGSQGKLSLGQEAVALEHGPLKVIVKCEIPSAAPTLITAHAFIASATNGTVFASWEGESNNLGPATPESERELNSYSWASSSGPYNSDSLSDVGVSATAANGPGFNATLGLASEKDSGTCWYWLNATILG